MRHESVKHAQLGVAGMQFLQSPFSGREAENRLTGSKNTFNPFLFQSPERDSSDLGGRRKPVSRSLESLQFSDRLHR